MNKKKKEKSLLKGKAEFSILCNDMFWKCLIRDYENMEFFHIKWYGYNDDFWWDNVSEKASISECIGDKGTHKKFVIDYGTLDVNEVADE